MFAPRDLKFCRLITLSMLNITLFLFRSSGGRFRYIIRLGPLKLSPWLKANPWTAMRCKYRGSTSIGLLVLVKKIQGIRFFPISKRVSKRIKSFRQKIYRLLIWKSLLRLNFSRNLPKTSPTTGKGKDYWSIQNSGWFKNVWKEFAGAVTLKLGYFTFSESERWEDWKLWWSKEKPQEDPERVRIEPWMNDHVSFVIS